MLHIPYAASRTGKECEKHEDDYSMTTYSAVPVQVPHQVPVHRFDNRETLRGLPLLLPSILLLTTKIIIREEKSAFRSLLLLIYKPWRKSLSKPTQRTSSGAPVLIKKEEFSRLLIVFAKLFSLIMKVLCFWRPAKSKRLTASSLV